MLATALVKQDAVAKTSGMRTVIWQQQLDGITIVEGTLSANITKDGELATLTSGFLADPASAADRGNANRHLLQQTPTVSAKRAIVTVAASLGETLNVGQVAAVSSPSAGDRGKPDDPEQKEQFEAPGFNNTIQVRLAWFPMDRSTLRLAWEVIACSHRRGETFDVLVDAETTALEADGTVWVWGSNMGAELGIGPPGSHQPDPVRNVYLTGVADVAVGQYQGQAITDSGALLSWGLLPAGDGTTTEHWTPLVLPFYGAANVQGTLWSTRYVLKDDGSIWGWGQNNWGQIDSAFIDKLVPTLLGADVLYFTTRTTVHPFRL